MKNSIHLQIPALESLLYAINHTPNLFPHSSPIKAMFEEVRSSEATRIENLITELGRRKAPNHPGPFKIRSRKSPGDRSGDRFLYITSVSGYNPTPHEQDAKTWKTAVGAEKALQMLDENFKLGSSFEIV